MTIEKRIASAIKDSGMTIQAVCNKTGISYSRLYPSLNGSRELRANEFISLCQILNLDPRKIEVES